MDRASLIFWLRSAIATTHGLDIASIAPETAVFGDLHLDSLDAADLLLSLRQAGFALDDDAADEFYTRMIFRNATVAELAEYLLPFYDDSP